MYIQEPALFTKNVITFPFSGLSAGITSSSFGDFHSKSKLFYKNIEALMLYLNAKNYIFLRAENKTRIANNFYYYKRFIKDSDALIIEEKDFFIILIHCSWLCLSNRIIEKTFNQFSSIKCSDISIFVYPGICHDCYEVDENFLTTFIKNLDDHFPSETFLYASIFEKDENNFSFDFKLYISFVLQNTLAIKPENISSLSTCSSCTLNSDGNYALYSNRARKNKERNAIFVKAEDSENLIISNSADCPFIIAKVDK